MSPESCLQSLHVLAGQRDIFSLKSICPLDVFSDRSLAFMDALATRIMQSEAMREFGEMIAFAYSMRSSQLRSIEANYRSAHGRVTRLPRGLIFHIAPSNVDTIFLYSYAYSILCGNKSVVRLPSATSDQMERVLRIIAELFENSDFEEVATRSSFVKYERSSDITQALSDFCDTRVIWGGNLSVNAIRELPLPPYATELVFADKISLAVFDAHAYSELDIVNRRQLATDFVKDSYTFNQQACSSPIKVIWRGEVAACEQASSTFWRSILEALQDISFEGSPIASSNKLLAEQLIATEADVRVLNTMTNRVAVHRLASGADFRPEMMCGFGFFAEMFIDALGALSHHLGSEVQTVLSFGIKQDDWRQFLASEKPPGINRIVAPGQALVFSSVWDGYDLLRDFTREISLRI